jgi:hypothetical protein
METAMRYTITLVLLLIANLAAAQAPPELTREKANKDQVLADATLTNDLRTADPMLQFLTDGDNQTAAVQYGREFDDNSWLVKLSGPLKKDAKRAVLATKDNLSTGTTAEVSFKHIFWPAPLSDVALAAICTKFLGRRDCGRADLPDEGKRLVDSADWSAWLAGGSVKVARQSFDYFDSSVGADAAATRNGRSWSASVGWFPPHVLYFASLSYGESTGYTAQDDATICTPVENVPGATNCRDIALGAPKQSKKNVAALELRQFFGSRVAVSPRFAYETDQRDWSVEVPIYFTGSGKTFNGGVSFGWDSKNREILASLFVGALPPIRR